MCTRNSVRFIQAQASREIVADKAVLEVGARDVNGSVRPIVETLKPASYLGVDILPGPGVDEICDVGDLTDAFGEDAFDLVISTEMVEHVRDWREAFEQMKRVLRPGGTLLVTTRSLGFGKHGFPYDFWRYEPEDMEVIFGDFSDVRVERDEPQQPGVFAAARKPVGWHPPDLSAIPLHSMVTRRRTLDVTDRQVAVFKALFVVHNWYRRLLPERARLRIKRIARLRET
jgi:SAM-dependent methyltransferase